MSSPTPTTHSGDVQDTVDVQNPDHEETVSDKVESKADSDEDTGEDVDDEYYSDIVVVKVSLAVRVEKGTLIIMVYRSRILVSMSPRKHSSTQDRSFKLFLHFRLETQI